MHQVDETYIEALRENKDIEGLIKAFSYGLVDGHVAKLHRIIVEALQTLGDETIPYLITALNDAAA